LSSCRGRDTNGRRGVPQQVIQLVEAQGPDWAVQLTAFSTLVSAFVLLVSAIYLGRSARAAVQQQKVAVQQQEDAKRTRHAELIVDLSRRWDEIMRSMQLFSTYREERLVELVRELYGTEPTEQGASLVRLLRRLRHRLRRQRVRKSPINDFITLIELPALIEAIGVLERDGGLSLSVIASLWGSTITSAWATWKPAVIEMRELTETATTYENFQRLAERLGGSGAT
jgi:hypothetical protein